MQIQYSIAQPQELEEVFSMVRCVIQAMHAAGIRQWHEDIYPRKDDLCRDIARGEMRIGRIGGRIAVIYVLNAEQEDSYNSAAWQHPEKSYRILHRLCVHPDFQNMGLARKTMEHMQKELLQMGIEVLRLDVFSKNPHAQRLYLNAGFRPTGTITEPIGDFIIMEKLLCKEDVQ